MNDQTWSMLIGFGVVVGLRLLDWVMPKGYVWIKVKEWSVRNDDYNQQGDINDRDRPGLSD